VGTRASRHQVRLAISPRSGSSFGRRCYFCAALHFAHLALVAALIRAKPAGEMRRRLGAIETTFRRPFTLAQRAPWAAAILARAAALIFLWRGWV